MKYLVLFDKEYNTDIVKGWIVSSKEDQTKAKALIDALMAVKPLAEKKTASLTKKIDTLSKKKGKSLYHYIRRDMYTVLTPTESSYTEDIQKVNRYKILPRDIDRYLKGQKALSVTEQNLIKELLGNDSLDFSIDFEYYINTLPVELENTDIPEEYKYTALKAYLILTEPTIPISWDII